jgi:hypothetical protein
MLPVMLPATALGIVLRRQIITLLFRWPLTSRVDLTADAPFYFLRARIRVAHRHPRPRSTRPDTLTPVPRRSSPSS